MQLKSTVGGQRAADDGRRAEVCRQLVGGAAAAAIALCLPLATMGSRVRSLRGHNKADKSPAGVCRMVRSSGGNGWVGGWVGVKGCILWQLLMLCNSA